jgi:hypothetical protein
LFKIFLTPEAEENLNHLKTNKSLEKCYKAAVKALKFLADNPRHPGLRTHTYESLSGPDGEKVFEAYAEQNTPAAYRIFWFYGPGKGGITVFAITPHP